MGPTMGTRVVNLQLIQDCVYCLWLITLHMADASLSLANTGMTPRTTMDAHLSTMAQGLAQHGSP